jgi:hypothetical protein
MTDPVPHLYVPEIRKARCNWETGSSLGSGLLFDNFVFGIESLRFVIVFVVGVAAEWTPLSR